MGLPRRVRLVAAAAAVALAAGCQSPHSTPKSVILIVVDTLRADGLSIYGNPRPTSPHLDALARQGVLFEQAISNAPWTLPAFIGILSGSYPSKRVFDVHLVRSLVQDFAQGGYATAAFTEGGYVSAWFGVDLGFQKFVAMEGRVHLLGRGQPVPEQSTQGGVEKTFAAARAWLETHTDRPFFLMVHTYEVHMPYTHRSLAKDLPRGVLPETYDFATNAKVLRGAIPVGPTETTYVRALYDSGVAAVDRQVGGLLETLDALGLADRTVVAVTADHGEEFGEHDPQRLGAHGTHLYDVLLHVPLILRVPNRRVEAHRIHTQVRLVDVLPTLLDLAGLPPAADTDGRSLVPLLAGREEPDREAYAEETSAASPVARRVAIRDGRYKLIVNVPPFDPNEVPAELYDIVSDPAEHRNLATVEVAEREALTTRLRTEREAIAREGVAALDTGNAPDAVRERLRALGYVR